MGTLPHLRRSDPKRLGAVYFFPRRRRKAIRGNVCPYGQFPSLRRVHMFWQILLRSEAANTNKLSCVSSIRAYDSDIVFNPTLSNFDTHLVRRRRWFKAIRRKP